MKPTLPQNDSSPELRLKGLDRARGSYQYNTDYYDLVMAEEVPKGDGYSMEYMAGVVKLKALLQANHVAGGTPKLKAEVAQGELEAVERGEMRATLDRLKADTIDGTPAARPERIEDYEAMFARVDRPTQADLWREDWYFGWQQIAGGTPTSLARMDRVPDKFPLTAAHYSRALGGRDSLDAALAEGRLYAVDYALLDGIPAGVTTGYQKHLWAPIAAFARTPGGELLPVGVQCGQTPGADNPIYTPRDGLRWEMARMTTQIAEVNWNGTTVHLGFCHLVMEAVILTSYRELSSRHPLMVLLDPHFEMTLVVNETARGSLINPGGYMDRLQSGTLEGSIELLKRGMSALRLDRAGLAADLKARGVDDTDALPVYPFRDDGLPVNRAIHRWVDGYLRLYYRADADVVADTELRAWRDALGAAGGLNGVPDLDTVAGLVTFVSDLLYRCTAYHSTINYSGYEAAGFPPNQPTAGFGPGPSPDREPTEADLLAMMPPLNVARGAFTLMYTLQETRYSQLGQYPRLHFKDPPVWPLLLAFQAELESVEAQTAARNTSRRLPYSHLLPSRIPQSIHV